YPTTLRIGTGGWCDARVTVDNANTYVPPATWWSSNPSAVQVDFNGNIYAAGYGTAVIYASVGGFTSGQAVTVPVPLPPLSISISGPTSITREGSYTWTAQVSNTVSGETVTHRWDMSTDGGATWTQVGTSYYYTRWISSGNPSFQLRLTSTSSAYRYPSSSSTTISVSVANPLPPAPLSVGVSGPNYITTAGWYTWTAYPSGGTTPYSYVWEKSTDGGSTWSLLIGSRYTYPIYTQTAEMYFGCGASGYLYYRVKVTSSDNQVSYGYSNTNVNVPRC
ncbi:MAG TPA: hypothetical protein VF771_07375, partial [Longimicrobiaceae bacterium]